MPLPTDAEIPELKNRLQKFPWNFRATPTVNGEAIGGAGAVSSVNSKTGAVVLVPGDITGFATIATSGAYADLTGKPTLATVATTGAYGDLSGKPTLATVSATGAYGDLSGTPSIPAAANPTGSIGLAASNGVAATFARSDALHALDPSIAPTWSGAHIFSNAVPISLTSAEPRVLFNESDQGSNLKLWDLDLNAGVMAWRTRTDADGAGVNAIAITRGSTTAISNLAFGNATNNPTFTFLGSGATTFGASVTASRFSPTGATAPSTAGIYLPGTNRLGFGIVNANVGEFDANGNFIIRKGAADAGYSKQTPTTGFSITIADNTQTLILKPAGTLASGTVTMPATPIDGQTVRIATSQIITALTVSPNTGQSIIAAPTTLTVGQGAAFIYSLADTTWYRLYLGN